MNIGKIGELIAANYILSKGWVILEKNWFNSQGYRIGELDLIAENKNRILVFLEVKTRVGKEFLVNPEENLHSVKLRNLVKIIHTYLNLKGWQGRDWRVDLIAITLNFQTRKFLLRHIKAIH